MAQTELEEAFEACKVENDQLRELLLIARQGEDDEVEGDIDEALREHEQELDRVRDDFLNQLREEQDF